MSGPFSFIDRPARPPRPRSVGLTMVLDKGLGLSAFSDLLETGSEHIDLIKLGWGTSCVIPRPVVEKKVALATAAGVRVSPGGTLLEIAWLQGKASDFFREALDLGFTCVEISDGTVPMPLPEKLGLIGTAREMGLRPLSEVGAKIAEEDQRLSAAARIAMIRAELDAGAWKVIMEAREGGNRGVFDTGGQLKGDLLQQLISAVSLTSLIFEAPKREQQVDLILGLGHDVNLGNIAPEDVIPLETLRLGLRSDTLRSTHMHAPVVGIELGPSGARAAALRGDVVVVIDALRASSTIVSALASGARAVRPVPSIDQCVGEVTAGERGGKKVPHLDLDNSPLAMTSERVQGKLVVLTTTNGTECLAAAASGPDPKILVGSLLNCTATAEAALRLARFHKRDIALVCAGRNNEMAPEDLLVATEIMLAMRGATYRAATPTLVSEDPVLDFLQSPSGRNLSSLGKTEDILACAKRDTIPLAAVFADGLIEVIA